MVKVESKEKLAKLLAMEDLDIQHRQVRTAMFDIKNRCLVLPVWKDMPNHLYDLLVGHEVGHALCTPNDEKLLTDLIKKTSKHCVNVVEDARIEALIKRKYPGLVKQFYKGYQHLVKEDFFGLSNVDLDEINLLDKINLRFKVPQTIEGLVEFNDEEEKIINRIEKIKKFSELEKICVDICKYIKENKKEEEKDSIFDEDSHQYENEDYENSDGEFNESENDETGEDNQESKTGDSEEENKESEATENSEGEEETASEENGEENNNVDNSEQQTEVNSGTQPSDDEDLVSETYESFEKNVNDLADTQLFKDREYLVIPEANNNNVIDYKKVYKNFDKFYDIRTFEAAKAKGEQALNNKYEWYWNATHKFEAGKKDIFKQARDTVNTIRKESAKTVNHMAMEFERKKRADIYKRTLVTKTGVLDTNKLFSAKYNEDVFRKNVRVPDGKNHGLVMIVDWSGSMSRNMKGCVKQLIELVLFCKKVNIPFEVYSFTDSSSSYNVNKKKSFDFREGDLCADESVSLRNYLSSRMTNKEFNEALMKFTVISNSFNQNGYQGYPIPEAERLGYTPLNGAIMLSEHVIRDFKERNNLQEVHAVWITDGEGNNTYGKWTNGKRGSADTYDKHLYFQDRKMKKTYGPINRYGFTKTMFAILKDRLDCNVIGFFLDLEFGKKNPMMRHYYKTDKKLPVNVWLNNSKKDGYVIATGQGYDEYYIISNNIKTENVKEIEEKMTATKMAALFSKKATNFKQSRVILSRFIDLITKKI